MLRVFFLVSSLVSPGVIWAQRNLDIEYVENIEPLHYVAQRSLGSIVIDGKLDEPSWQRAQWTPAFVDIEGDRKERPAFLTRAKMLWDDKYFYDDELELLSRVNQDDDNDPEFEIEMTFESKEEE